MVLLVLLPTLMLAACSRQIGHEFDKSAVDQLVPGQSTVADATRLLGQPVRTRAYVGGKVLVRWAYIRAGESAAVDIMFDDDGRMVSIIRRH
ncbi:MAG: hypothetical protein HYX38_20695 [Rhodospirillales bacterium]|nr:hypothetical protein [Rhodospirillales bacterium]